MEIRYNWKHKKTKTFLACSQIIVIVHSDLLVSKALLAPERRICSNWRRKCIIFPCTSRCLWDVQLSTGKEQTLHKSAQQQRQGENCIQTRLPAIHALPYFVGHSVLPAWRKVHVFSKRPAENKSRTASKKQVPCKVTKGLKNKTGLAVLLICGEALGGCQVS